MCEIADAKVALSSASESASANTAPNTAPNRASLVQSVLEGPESATLAGRIDALAKHALQPSDVAQPASGRTHSTAITVHLFENDDVKQFDVMQISKNDAIIHWFVVVGCGDMRIVCDVWADNLVCLQANNLARLKRVMHEWTNIVATDTAADTASVAGNADRVAAIVTAEAMPPCLIFEDD